MLGSPAMHASLFIPWFRLESWDIPLPFSLPVLGDTLSIQPFGVLVATGVLLGAWVAGRFAQRNDLDTIATGDLVTYAVVTGFILLIVLRSLPFDILFTWWAAVFAASIVSVPLLIRTTRAAIEVIDPRLPHVAATLGASRLRSLRTITWPLAWKGIVGGVLLAWARALGEFGATIVVAGNIPGETRTIPLAIWTAIQSRTQVFST